MADVAHAQGVHVLCLLATPCIDHGMRSIRQESKHVYTYTYICIRGSEDLFLPSHCLQHMPNALQRKLLKRCCTQEKVLAHCRGTKHQISIPLCKMLCRCFTASANHREQHMLNALRRKSLMRCCTKEKVPPHYKGTMHQISIPLCKMLCRCFTASASHRRQHAAKAAQQT